MTDIEMSNIVERLHRELPGISTPVMRGDNLAIILCTSFDDGDEETQDDCGWSKAATDGYEEVIAAIRNHYAPLADEIARLTRERDEALTLATNYNTHSWNAAIEAAAEKATGYERWIGFDLAAAIRQLKRPI